MGDALHHLLGHTEVVIGRRRQQRLVGDAEHLPLGRQTPQQLGHRTAHPAADTGVDLIEQQGDVRIGRRQAGFQGQQKARHLAAGGHLRQRRQGLAGVGGEQELHRIGPLLPGCGGRDRHGEAHVGQPHRPQGLHQLLLQRRGSAAAGCRERSIGPVAASPGGSLSGLKRLKAGLSSARGELRAQRIAPMDQFSQILAMAAFQGLELSDALLQLGQAVGIAFQAGAVAIEITGQILQLGQAITAAGSQGGHGRIQLLHLGQLRLAGCQVIEHRRCLVGPLLQPADQGHHPLLQAHAMGQAVLLRLQALPLGRILQPGGLEILEQLLLAGPLLLQLLPVGLGLLQGRCRLPPGPAGLGHLRQLTLQGLAGEAIQPATLLTRTGQLLGLPLHGEIEQQRPQLLDLRAVHRHAIEPVAAAEPALAQAPLAAEQDLALLILKLLLLQPGLQRRRQAETRLDHAPLRPLAQQPRTGTAARCSAQ